MDPLVHTRDQGTVETVDFAGKPAPKKAKTVLSAGKVMATVFWYSQGVIYIDYLEKGKTVTGMPNYFAHSPPNCRKYGPIWRRKKSSSIMTTHRLSLPPSPRPNWSNWATNCYPIHHIPQIWPRVTSFCSFFAKTSAVSLPAMPWWLGTQ